MRELLLPILFAALAALVLSWVSQPSRAWRRYQYLQWSALLLASGVGAWLAYFLMSEHATLTP